MKTSTTLVNPFIERERIKKGGDRISMVEDEEFNKLMERVKKLEDCCEALPDRVKKLEDCCEALSKLTWTV